MGTSGASSVAGAAAIGLSVESCAVEVAIGCGSAAPIAGFEVR
ncbi:MAG: hypothetical protein WA405_10275 [Candidatus Acidiferrales bacterium]